MNFIILSIILSAGLVLCVCHLVFLLCIACFKRYNCSCSRRKAEELRDITDTEVPKYDELSIQEELPSYLQTCTVYENESKETQDTGSVWV